MRDPKYPRSSTANTTVERDTLNFIGFCCYALFRDKLYWFGKNWREMNHNNAERAPG